MTVLSSENSTAMRRARTRFVVLGRRGAMLVLVVVGVLGGVGLRVGAREEVGRAGGQWWAGGLGWVVVVCLRVGRRETVVRPELKGQRGDLALYQAILKRVSGGEGYYEVVAGELRGRGFGMQSVFNWRTPMLTWALARLPNAKW